MVPPAAFSRYDLRQRMGLAPEKPVLAVASQRVTSVTLFMRVCEQSEEIQYPTANCDRTGGVTAMGAIQEFFDNLPLPRWAIWALAVLLLVTFLMPGTNSSRRGDMAYANFEAGLKAREQSVMQSLETLTVSDPLLLECIRAAAMDRARIHPMNTGGIDDARELTMLYCPSRDIRSLAGLNELTRLTYLDLSRNRIESVAPLRDHPSLERLQLVGNPIDDIKEVSSLPRLQQIYLPDLPQERCGTLEAAFSGVSNNIKRTNCTGKTTTSSQTAQRSSSTSNTQSDQYTRAATLSDAEHRELMEYERKLRKQ